MGAEESQPALAPPGGEVPRGGEILTRTGPDLAAVSLHLYEAGSTASSLPLGLAWLMGWGTYQCGIEVYGVEWTYDGRDGVSWRRPRSCRGRSLCRSIRVGTTLVPRHEALEHARLLRDRWTASNYNAAERHSGHFAVEYCQRLGIGPVAPWVEYLHSPAAMAASTEGADFGCPQRASTAFRFCCIEGASNAVVVDKVNVAEVSVSDEAMEKFESWTTAYVDKLKCEVPPRSDLSTGRTSVKSAGSLGSVSSEGERPPAYRLIRERWLRNRRAKSRTSGAFSVQPPRSSPSCGGSVSGSAFTKDLGSVTNDGTEGSTGTGVCSIISESHSTISGSDIGFTEEHMVVRVAGETGIVVGEGRPLYIIHVDRTRENLDELEVGDIITAVNGVPVADFEDFEERTEGLHDFMLSARRPDSGNLQDSHSVLVEEDYQRLTEFWQGKSSSGQQASLGQAKGEAVPPLSLGARQQPPPLKVWEGGEARQLSPRSAGSSTDEVAEAKLGEVSRWIDGYMEAVETRKSIPSGGEGGVRSSGPAAASPAAPLWWTLWPAAEAWDTDGGASPRCHDLGRLQTATRLPPASGRQAWIGRTPELVRAAHDIRQESRSLACGTRNRSAVTRRARKVAHL